MAGALDWRTMPQTWFVDTPAPGHALGTHAVGLLLEAAHEAAPAAKLLRFIHALVPVEYLSLVEYAGRPGDEAS